MLDTERRTQMVAHIESSGGARVDALVEMFGVSAATIRRDLTYLDEHGLIVRAHGGATPKRGRTPAIFEAPMLDRSLLMVEQKREIGRTASQYVEDGDVIYISGGTTTVEMVRHLADRRDLTIITSALNIACLLAVHPRISTIVVGGTLRHSELSMLGPIAEDALAGLRADRLFMGTTAIHHEHGLSADDTTEMQNDRKIIAASGEVFVLADHTKLGRIATVRLASISAVRCVVTDSEASLQDVAALRESGVEVRLAYE